MSEVHDKPKILFVNSALHIGGAETVTANLLRGIDRARFDAKLCCLADLGPVGERLAAQGEEIFVVPQRRGLRGKRTSSLRLQRYVVENGVELVHSNDLHAFIDCAVCRLITPGLKHVHTFHFGNYPHIERKYLLIETICSRLASALVAVGVKQSDAICRALRLNPKRLQVIGNGLMPHSERGAIECSIMAGETRFKLGTISTLMEQKNVESLLRIAAILKRSTRDFVVLVAGEGHLRSELEAMATELDVQDHVRFLGWVPNAAEAILPELDVFIQTSRWEGMSMVILEAMLAQRPIVATCVGDNEYVLREGETGYLFDVDDDETAAGHVLRLMQDQALRERLGKRAYEEFQAKYSADTMIESYMALYDRLLGRGATICR